MHATTTANLEQQLRAEGWQDGAPAHIDASLVAADVRIYRRQHCGECACRRQLVKPMHKGAAYRLVCTCRRCGTQQEA